MTWISKDMHKFKLDFVSTGRHKIRGSKWRCARRSPLLRTNPVRKIVVLLQKQARYEYVVHEGYAFSFHAQQRCGARPLHCSSGVRGMECGNVEEFALLSGDRDPALTYTDE